MPIIAVLEQHDGRYMHGMSDETVAQYAAANGSEVSMSEVRVVLAYLTIHGVAVSESIGGRLFYRLNPTRKKGLLDMDQEKFSVPC